MNKVFRAHFDGKVLIPEEPVELPLNESMELEVREKQGVSEDGPPYPRDVWMRKLKELSGGVKGFTSPSTFLRQDNAFDEREGV